MSGGVPIPRLEWPLGREDPLGEGSNSKGLAKGRATTRGYAPDIYQAEKRLGLRKPNGGMRLKRLRAKHYAIIDAHMAGISNREIAEIGGLSEPWVSSVLNDPLVESVIAQRVAANSKRLNGLQVRAFDVHQEAMAALTAAGSPAHTTRLRAAENILKASGHLGPTSAGGGPREGETAEDVIQRMLQLNVQVNVEK